MTKNTNAKATEAIRADLEAKLANPRQRNAILGNPKLRKAILDDPRTTDIMQAAIEYWESEDDDEDNATSDPLADLLASLDDPKPTKSPSKKAKPPKPVVAYTYRVAKYAASTVGAVTRGKERGPSAKTIAIERINAQTNEVVDRFLLGVQQATMLASLTPDELAKLPRAK